MRSRKNGRPWKWGTQWAIAPTTRPTSTLLAARLDLSGYGIRRTEQHFEFASVSRELVEKFSRRTEVIEQRARDKYKVLEAEARALMKATNMAFDDGFAHVIAEIGGDWDNWKSNLGARNRAIAGAVRKAMKKNGLLSHSEHSVARLQRLNLTDSQQRDVVAYEPRQIVEFHRIAKGSVRKRVQERRFKSGEQWELLRREEGVVIVGKDGVEKQLHVAFTPSSCIMASRLIPDFSRSEAWRQFSLRKSRKALRDARPGYPVLVALRPHVRGLDASRVNFSDPTARFPNRTARSSFIRDRKLVHRPPSKRAR